MVLTFIGMGLHDPLDLSVKGVETAKRCDKVYVEHYTSLMPGFTIKDLEKLLKRKVEVLTREDLEGEKGKKLVEEAKVKDVALLTPGDPFIATTHVTLRLAAKKAGVEARVIHSSSIATAAPGLVGLSFYKFGKTATVVYPEPGYYPETPYDVLKENLRRGLHTLLVLDLKVERGLYMSIPEALQILLSIEERRLEKVLDLNTLVVGIARAGSLSPTVKAESIERLMKISFGPPPHSLIFPGRLHFIEEEALIELCEAPRDVIEKHKAKFTAP